MNSPNASADVADSLFFEINLTGSSPIVVSIPHKKPTSCPYPIVTKGLRTSANYYWNKHTTWRGNRAPDLCQQISLSGFDALEVKSGYKARVNFINYAPSWTGYYFNVEAGAVMEINALPYY
jgi:hypothetical protein